jgi:hypothetical protein
MPAVFCRQLRSVLPPLDRFPSQALGPLAQLHLQSYQDLNATAKLLLPGAFKGAAATLDVDALGDIDSVLNMLSNVIELQLFHLLRAQAITGEMRMRIAAKHYHHHQQQQQQVHQQDASYAAVSSSSSSSSSSDSDMSMGYLE